MLRWSVAGGCNSRLASNIIIVDLNSFNPCSYTYIRESTQNARTPPFKLCFIVVPPNNPNNLPRVFSKWRKRLYIVIYHIYVYTTHQQATRSMLNANSRSCARTMYARLCTTNDQSRCRLRCVSVFGRRVEAMQRIRIQTAQLL